LVSAEWCAFTNFPWGRGLINFLPEEEAQALVFITRSPESFAAARLERLRISGNPHQYDNLQIYIEEQELMRRLVGESRLPALNIDISDNNIPAAVERIANWMESTGGLWMN
jgi:hypothetical protein